MKLSEDGLLLPSSSLLSSISLSGKCEEALGLVQAAITETNGHLSSLLEANKDHFDSYQSRLEAMQQEWTALADSITKHHDLLAPLKSIIGETLAAINILTEPEDDSDLLEPIIRHRALLHTLYWAKLHDYERVLVGDDLGRMRVSRKTANFHQQVIERIRATHGLSSQSSQHNSLLRDLVSIYFMVFQESFSAQINGLPHLSALFYNDCRWLANDNHIEDYDRNDNDDRLAWFDLGVAVLEGQVKK